MGKRKLFIFTVCLAAALICLLSACVFSSGGGGNTNKKRTLIVETAGELYAGRVISFSAVWSDDGAAASVATAKVSNDLPEGHPYKVKDAPCNYGFQPEVAATYTLTVTAADGSTGEKSVTVKYDKDYLNEKFSGIGSLDYGVRRKEFCLGATTNYRIEYDKNLLKETQFNDYETAGIGAFTFKIFETNSQTAFFEKKISINAGAAGEILRVLKEQAIIPKNAESAMDADFEKVTELDLSGKLYPYKNYESLLTKFSNLKALNLSGNNLLSVSFLSAFEKLESLDISFNLTSEFDALAALNKLEYLDARENNLPHNYSREWFSNIAELKTGEIVTEPSGIPTADGNTVVYQSIEQYTNNYLQQSGAKKPCVVLDIKDGEYPVYSESNPLKLTILAETESMYIVGSPEKTLLNAGIEISERETVFELHIKDFKIKAEILGNTGRSALSTVVNTYIKLYYSGDNSFEGGAGKHGISAWNILVSGENYCTPETGDKLFLKGGNGLDGQKGTTNKDGTGRIGGMGTAGGCGLLARDRAVFRKTYDISFEGGNGGAGGAGGDSKFNLEHSLDYRYWSGGNGGTGGNGGWGVMGNSIYINVSLLNNFKVKAGAGGEGGAGGKNKFNYDSWYDGKAGENGASGGSQTSSVLPQYT